MTNSDGLNTGERLIQLETRLEATDRRVDGNDVNTKRELRSSKEERERLETRLSATENRLFLLMLGGLTGALGIIVGLIAVIFTSDGG